MPSNITVIGKMHCTLVNELFKLGATNSAQERTFNMNVFATELKLNLFIVKMLYTACVFRCSLEDNGGDTCEIRSRKSTVLHHVTHTVSVHVIINTR